MSNTSGNLFEAISFAARAHEGQKRKDKRTPYVSHVFRVAMTLSQVFGVRDSDILTAAVLHDTLEDTTTDFDDLAELFSPRIANWVALLSKDSRLEKDEREKVYARQLGSAPSEVKLIKLADMHDNLQDYKSSGSKKPKKFAAKMQVYFDVLCKDKNPLLKSPLRIVESRIEDLRKSKA